MSFNLSETMLLLVSVFSRLIAENDRSKVHLVTGEKTRLRKEALILLKSLHGMHFGVPDILFERQSLLSSQYDSLDNLYFLANLIMIPISPPLPPTLCNRKNHI